MGLVLPLWPGSSGKGLGWGGVGQVPRFNPSGDKKMKKEKKKYLPIKKKIGFSFISLSQQELRKIITLVFELS